MAAAKPQPHTSPARGAGPADASPAPGAGPADADGAGVAAFRLLLPPSFSDADSVRLYAAVNPLRGRTAALEVRVEPLDPASARGRVVAVVIGPTAPVRRVEASSSSAAPLALSPAQEALVAVMDTHGALYCAGEEEARGKAPPGRVRCVLLVDADRLEASAGRVVMERISLEAGASVRVATWEEGPPPPRGQPPEEVVEIIGDRTAVRKALVALSSCLQGELNSTTYVEEEGSILPWASPEVPEPNMGTLCSEASTEFSHANTQAVQSQTLQQVSFRLLLPICLAGGLIDKKGLIIKGIEDETGAYIDVGAPVTGCKERVITICALESPHSECHIVQSALLQIFDKMVELESNAHSTFEKAPQFLVRALVLKNHLDCCIIKGMVNATGARIQILDDTDVPACAFNFELVLQITGDRTAVRKALVALSSCLQGDIQISKSTTYVKEEGSILPWESPKVPRHPCERTPSPPAKRRRGRSLPPAGSPLRPPGDHRRSSSSPPSPNRRGKVPMGIFWDLENCTVPNDAKVEEVAEYIRDALSMDIDVDSTAPIQAYGKAAVSTIKALKRSGVSHTGIIKRKKDAADKLIWADMFSFALDNPPPACILMITGDSDFAPAVRVLVERGYEVIIALPNDGTASSELLSVGTYLWDWPSLVRGQGIVTRLAPVGIEGLKNEMIQLYTAHGGYVEIGEIQKHYTKMFGKQVKLNDYKVCKMVDLFEKMGTPFSVLDRKTVVLGTQSAQSNMIDSSMVPTSLIQETPVNVSKEEDDKGDGIFEASVATNICEEEPETAAVMHASDVTPGIGHWDATHGRAGDATPSVRRNNRWDETPTPGRMADADATPAAGGATPGATPVTWDATAKLPGGVTPTPGKKQRSRWDEMPASMGSATPGGVGAATSGGYTSGSMHDRHTPKAFSAEEIDTMI